MTQRGAKQIENLRDEATCPACEYSLRGLEGDEVTCPECGLRINLAAYFANKWTGPWHQVPGFNSLLMPVAWLLAGCVVVPVSMTQRGDKQWYLPKRIDQFCVFNTIHAENE